MVPYQKWTAEYAAYHCPRTAIPSHIFEAALDWKSCLAFFEHQKGRFCNGTVSAPPRSQTGSYRFRLGGVSHIHFHSPHFFLDIADGAIEFRAQSFQKFNSTRGFAMQTFFLNGWSRLNRRWLAQGVSLILLGLAVASCSEKKNASSAAGGEKVIIRGSNTVGEELAPKLIAEYKKAHPDVAFDLESKGTSYGMGALMGGYCDIAGASRLPTKEELEVAQFRNVEFNDYVIGSYAVAVVVGAGNAITNLTREQVRDIFTGVVQNWKDVGGADASIHLYARDPISGTYLGFKELAMENKPYTSDPKMLTLFTNYEGIVKAVTADPNGIGYASFEPSKMAGVKAVSIGGVAPSVAAVNQSQYPYARTLHLYTSKEVETPATTGFIQFVQSSGGQRVLAQMGDVPHQ
jgi:phosphate transport system substrate-binding protein